MCQGAGIILCMCLANERRRYIVMSSFIGWAHTQNDPRGDSALSQTDLHSTCCADRCLWCVEFSPLWSLWPCQVHKTVQRASISFQALTLVLDLGLTVFYNVRRDLVILHKGTTHLTYLSQTLRAHCLAWKPKHHNPYRSEFIFKNSKNMCIFLIISRC